VRGAHWLRPKLVAEIAYTEMTNEGTLRHPSYLGLREDKKAEAVVLETEAPVAEIARRRQQGQDQQPRARDLPRVEASPRASSPIITPPSRRSCCPGPGSRPISLVRCPQGRAKKCFFQKHDAGSFGDTVKHVGIRRRTGTRSPISSSTPPMG
jgi:bifunctional non-homologous end joining protein LigD